MYINPTLLFLCSLAFNVHRCLGAVQKGKYTIESTSSYLSKSEEKLYYIYLSKCLYKIVNHEGKTSYLCGISHISTKAWALHEGIQKIIPKIDYLVTEANYKDKAFINYRKKVRDLLLEVYDPSSFEKTKPFFDYLLQQEDPQKEVPFLYLEPGYLGIIPFSGDQLESTEQMLYKALGNKIKEVGGLDNFQWDDHQVEKFAKFTADKCLKQLRQYERDASFRNHIHSFYAIFVDAFCNPKYNRVLVPLDRKTYKYGRTAERNKAWIPIMENWIQKGHTLFAVGAYHLIDPEGLIYLLLDRGYTLYRLTPEGEEILVTKDNYNDFLILSRPKNKT